MPGSTFAPTQYWNTVSVDLSSAPKTSMKSMGASGRGIMQSTTPQPNTTHTTQGSTPAQTTIAIGTNPQSTLPDGQLGKWHAQLF